MSNARDKANIPALNFSSTGIDDNATSTAITIDSLGKVGIGTASPTSALHIQNTTGDKRRLRIAYDGSYYYDLWQLGAGGLSFNAVGGLFHRWENNGSEVMRINNSGNVGIGTTSPTGKLNIATATSDGVNTLFGANVSPTAAGMYVGFNDSDATATLGVYYASNPIPAINITRSDRTIKFMNDATERMRIDSSGNVGIGTSTPTTIASDTTTATNDIHLNVKSSADARIVAEGNGGGSLVLVDSNATSNQRVVRLESSSGKFQIQGDNDNGIGSGSAPAGNIIVADLSNGKVGIGTSTPTAKLDVTETIQIDNTVTIGGSAFTGDFDIQLNNLVTVNGNSHRRYGLRLSYAGIAGDATNAQQKDVLINIAGLSSWSSATPVDTGGGTIAVTVTSSSSNSMNIRVTTPGSSTVGAYVATLFASGDATMICYG